MGCVSTSSWFVVLHMAKHEVRDLTVCIIRNSFKLTKRGGIRDWVPNESAAENIKIVFAVAVSELRVDVLIRFGASAVVVHDERACWSSSRSLLADHRWCYIRQGCRSLLEVSDRVTMRSSFRISVHLTAFSQSLPLFSLLSLFLMGLDNRLWRNIWFGWEE